MLAGSVIKYKSPNPVNMKTAHPLIIITALTVCLFACNKGGSDINPNDIVGKWYENKLNIKQQTIGMGAVADTTYLSNNFTVVCLT